MNTVLRAFILFAVLLVLVLLLGQSGLVPLPLTLTIGSMVVKTTAPIALTFAIAILAATFYVGRFTGWLLRLPHRMINRRKLAAAEHLADAYAALALNAPDAARHLADLKTDNPALLDLATLLHLHTETLSPRQSEAALANPRLTAVTALFLARKAANQSDWEEVKRLTTLGRQYAPANLPLLVLQFKALVNLNDPTAAELLPALKPHLDKTHHKLLSQLITPGTAVATTTVTDPWAKTFRHWLATGTETFPSDE